MDKPDAPVLFGRRMKRIHDDTWIAKVAQLKLHFFVWSVPGDPCWRGTAVFGATIVVAVRRRTMAGTLSALETRVLDFSRKLSKLTNSQEGDEVR